MTKTTRLSRAVATVASAVLAVGAAYASTPAHADTTPPPATVAPTPLGAPFTAFTLNVEFTLSTPQATSDATKAMTLGSVGGFQEYSGRADRNALAQAVAARGWQIYMPAGAGVNIPIVWDAHRFSLVDTYSTLVYGDQGRLSKARAINAVRLRDTTTGRVYGFVNTHTIAGGARAAMPTNPAKAALLRLQLARLASVISSESVGTQGVVALGDWNVNYLNDRKKRVAGFPTAVLGGLVNFDMPLTGSRGPLSLLDYVVSTKTAAFAKTISWIASPFYSDHDAVVARFQPFVPGTGSRTH